MCVCVSPLLMSKFFTSPQQSSSWLSSLSTAVERHRACCRLMRRFCCFYAFFPFHSSCFIFSYPCLFSSSPSPILVGHRHIHQMDRLNPMAMERTMASSSLSCAAITESGKLERKKKKFSELHNLHNCRHFSISISS